MKTKFSAIHNGKYSVKLDLGNLLDRAWRLEFRDRLAEVFDHDKDFKDVCRLKGDILCYESETLLPLRDDSSKGKILFVFGNPAIHSVKRGMFFFSRADMRPHSMWGKLARACVVREVSSANEDLLAARKEEANLRREMILKGVASEMYLVGLTTFYSFPTPVTPKFRYSNVKGVENLFKPILDKVAEMEVERLMSFPPAFRNNMVFVQKSTYRTYCSLTGMSPLFWPVRGRGSSGADLAKLLP